jgi:hypothetical protein
MPQQRVHFSRRTIYRMYQQRLPVLREEVPDRGVDDRARCAPEPGRSHDLDRTAPWRAWGATPRKANRTPEEAGMKLLTKPYKPKFSIFKGDQRIKEWDAFLGEAYWSVELDNDMK